MANPFVKGWHYMMALFGAKIDEYADPKVQIQQAIEDAQRQHQALVQQAADVPVDVEVGGLDPLSVPGLHAEDGL